MARKRNWNFIFYEESAPDWRDVIARWQVPCIVSPLHDRDVWTDADAASNPDRVAGAVKKPHRHGIMCFDGPKPYEEVCEMLAQLGSQHPEPCRSLKMSFAYLTHENDADKAQYDAADLVNFGFPLDKVCDKTKSIAGLCRLAREYNMESYADLVNYLLDHDDYDGLATAYGSSYVLNTYIQGIVWRAVTESGEVRSFT